MLCMAHFLVAAAVTTAAASLAAVPHSDTPMLQHCLLPVGGGVHAAQGLELALLPATGHTCT